MAAHAETVVLPSASIEFSPGWTIEPNHKGSVIASPNGPRSSDIFAFAQSCTPKDQRDCDPTCEVDAIRRNFFKANGDLVEVTTKSGLLYVKLDASQKQADGRTLHTSRLVACTAAGLLSLSTMSSKSQLASKELLNSVTDTINWR
jgi:hypothetical protein